MLPCRSRGPRRRPRLSPHSDSHASRCLRRWRLKPARRKCSHFPVSELRLRVGSRVPHRRTRPHVVPRATGGQARALRHWQPWWDLGGGLAARAGRDEDPRRPDRGLMPPGDDRTVHLCRSGWGRLCSALPSTRSGRQRCCCWLPRARGPAAGPAGPCPQRRSTRLTRHVGHSSMDAHERGPRERSERRKSSGKDREKREQILPPVP